MTRREAHVPVGVGADPGYTRAMKPCLVRPALGALLLALPLLTGCGEKVGTGETGETGTTTEASTGGGGGTTTTGATSEAVTTGGIATVTSETHATHTTQPPGCNDIGCGACPEGCTAQDECVEGEWQCICDCPATTGASTGAESTGGGGIMCGGEDPQFPEFDRTCMLDRDCTVVFHQTDCCGTLVAWGLSGAAGKPFNEAEAECVAQYPACDCAPMPTAADDGKSTEDPTQIMVTCMGNMCSSFVP